MFRVFCFSNLAVILALCPRAVNPRRKLIWVLEDLYGRTSELYFRLSSLT
jgi:hypothetical protein